MFKLFVRLLQMVFVLIFLERKRASLFIWMKEIEAQDTRDIPRAKRTERTMTFVLKIKMILKLNLIFNELVPWLGLGRPDLLRWNNFYFFERKFNFSLVM